MKTLYDVERQEIADSKKKNRVRQIKDFIYKFKQERNYYKVDRLKYLLKQELKRVKNARTQ